MRNKAIKGMLLAACAFTCTAKAYEVRAPLVTERGALRYDIEKKSDKWSLSWWSTGHVREANKSFLKHGFETKSLPAVIFGKEEFTLSESFQNADSDQAFFENRNPFLKIHKFTPRASYSERGMTLGGRFEYPVWNNKGRVGLRAALPFRTVRMERDDQESDPFSGLESSVIRGDAVRITDGATTPKVFFPISRYKLSLLKSLMRIGNDGSVRSLLVLGSGGEEEILQTTNVVNADYNKKSEGVAGYVGGGIPFVISKAQFADEAPFGTPTGVTVVGGGDAAKYAEVTGVVSFGTQVGKTVSNLVALPHDLAGLDVNKGYAFVNDKDYRALAAQPGFDQLWVSTVFAGDSGNITSLAASAHNIIEGELQRYQVSLEEWLSLYGNGFEFATNQHTGIGDLDLDAFYEHSFNDDWRAELMLGVRFPTGGTHKFCANPYRISQGNGNHFEVKLGGNLGWAPFDWLTFKADAYYSFALESTEKRPAAFKDATIKNIGPCVEADVDYGYFVGRLDATWTHPKVSALSTTVGYEFYFKTEDNVHFKLKATSDHFLGRAWSGADGVAVKVEGDPGTKFADYPMELDNKVASMNSESISHRIRSEVNWRANKYFDLFCGGAWTFAGQHIFSEADMHGGINVRF